MSLLRHPLWLLVPACIGVWTLVGVVSVPALAPLVAVGEQRYSMNALQRRQIFVEIAGHENRWRGYGARKFPEAPWSAEDDYHWHVQAHIERTLARRHKLPSSHIWALYDEAVHDRWPHVGIPAGAGFVHPHFLAASATLTTTPTTAAPTAALRAAVVPLRPRQH